MTVAVEDAFALRLNVTLGANLSISSDASGSSLVPQFNALSFPARVANSTVGPVFVLTPLINLLNFVVETVGVPLLNRRLAQGLPIPSSPQVRPSNSQVAIRHEYLVVATDIELAPQ